MRSIIKILDLLRQDNIIKSVGFVAGMVYTIFGDKQMCPKINYDNEITDRDGNQTNTNVKVDSSQLSVLENPLYTLLIGSINGAIYGMCATFVGEMLPYKIKPLVPIFLSISMINSVYKWTKK